MKCKKCGNDLFLIEERKDCSTCEHNGVWDEDKKDYVYDVPHAPRDQVEENGECAMGDAHGAGCHMYTCVLCDEQNIFPFSND